jgi:murein DD-endopeptidase MepM/ murein hydrolase activator NlpD
VPFASGGRPIWPIAPGSTHPRKFQVPYRDADGKWHGNMARAFRASRSERFHAGVDLYANGGDVLLAPEDGVVVGRQPFLNGTGALLLQLDSGIVVLLGETRMGGAGEFGIDVGSRVRQGQPLTRVGVTNAGSHMLHLETYRAGTKHNSPWYKNRPPPANLLDPTEWMLQAKANSQPPPPNVA